MLDTVNKGASVTMTAVEANKFAGDGTVRLVTCPDGRVIGGVGQVGMVEHAGDTDVVAFVEEVKAKRKELADRATGPQPSNPRENLFTFIKI
ncbi:MAG: hypothetical protein M0Z99_33965 [Betaproteobacteria bacterium]|nr:hypothetical protein [Betaproteobacteria bacterium]